MFLSSLKALNECVTDKNIGLTFEITLCIAHLSTTYVCARSSSVRERERERETDRQTDRQRQRQRDRDRETERDRDRETVRDRER